jgi:site-specific DNA-cytosine methylase
MNKKLKWGTIVPLIGGMTIGNKHAIGEDPDWLMSYKDFAGNEQALKDNMPNIPFYTINENHLDIDKATYDAIGGTDVISAVCPCAGLSMLNSGGNVNESMKKGSDAIQNRWIYNSSQFILSQIKPKVLFGENAPGLFTTMGLGMVERLKTIAKDNGYSLSIYKTSTHFHGIPQRRMRTFYFFWKSETAPLMNWYNREMTSLEDYLNEIPKDATLLNHFPTPGVLTDDISYKWMKETWGDNWRNNLMDSGFSTMWQYFDGMNMLDEMIEYSNLHGDLRGVKYFNHIKNKRADNKGFWDSSPHLYGDIVNAVISKNMCSMIHPIEERFLTTREYMHLMGLPHDFIIPEKKAMTITQNVPTCTARDMTYEVIKFINGELKLSKTDFLKQDNNTKTNIESKIVKVKELF